jgi:hypothetical protein
MAMTVRDMIEQLERMERRSGEDVAVVIRVGDTLMHIDRIGTSVTTAQRELGLKCNTMVFSVEAAR